jgi:hypothetical protein
MRIGKTAEQNGTMRLDFLRDLIVVCDEIADHGAPDCSEAHGRGLDVHSAFRIRQASLDQHFQISGRDHADNRALPGAAGSRANLVLKVEIFHGPSLTNS